MKTSLKNHRNIFNGDCDCLFYVCKWNHWKPKKGERFSVKAIHQFVDLLADSGVDTYLINPNGQKAYYRSKVVPYAWQNYRRGDHSFFYGHILGQPLTQQQADAYLQQISSWADRYLDLDEAGVDWLAEAIQRCRQRQISPWVSVRMNDMHGSNSYDGSFMNAPLLADPKFRLRGTPINSKEEPITYWEGLNFEKREVRDYMMRMIRELVEDYDTEGLELDWTRTYLCCNPVASPKTIQLITDWHRQIRELTQKKARKTGRPYPFGLRITSNIEFLRNMGLDVQAMARAGIIDFIAPTHTWQTSWDLPYDQWRKEFGSEIALYGMIEDAPNWLPAYHPKTKKRELMRYLSASAPLLRGNAAGKLVMGVDGLVTFNFFCTDPWEDAGGDYPALRGLENLERLRGKPKQYALATGPALWTEPLIEWPHQLPAVLEPQWHRNFRLSMCAEPANKGLTLTIQVVVEKTDQPANLGVSFNSSWPNFDAQPTDKLFFPVGTLTHHVPEHTAFNYRFPVSAIREGWNEIFLVNGSRKRGSAAERRENSVTVVSLELAVK